MQQLSVLRNTYILLSLSIIVSALSAVAGIMMQVPEMPWWVSLVGMIGLLVATMMAQDTPLGIVLLFCFTSFCGFMIAPLLDVFLGAGMGHLIWISLFATSVIFLSLSAYILLTGKDMSGHAKALFIGFIVVLVAMLMNLYLQIAFLSIVISCVVIVLSSIAIMVKTSEIMTGRETSAVSATISLYLDILNLFLHILSLLAHAADD